MATKPPSLKPAPFKSLSFNLGALLNLLQTSGFPRSVVGPFQTSFRQLSILSWDPPSCILLLFHCGPHVVLQHSSSHSGALLGSLVKVDHQTHLDQPAQGCETLAWRSLVGQRQPNTQGKQGSRQARWIPLEQIQIDAPWNGNAGFSDWTSRHF